MNGITYSSYFKKRYIPQPQYAGLWSVTALFSVNKRALFDQVATGQLIFQCLEVDERFPTLLQENASSVKRKLFRAMFI